MTLEENIMKLCKRIRRPESKEDRIDACRAMDRAIGYYLEDLVNEEIEQCIH